MNAGGTKPLLHGRRLPRPPATTQSCRLLRGIVGGVERSGKNLGHYQTHVGPGAYVRGVPSVSDYDLVHEGEVSVPGGPDEQIPIALYRSAIVAADGLVHPPSHEKKPRWKDGALGHHRLEARWCPRRPRRDPPLPS